MTECDRVDLCLAARYFHPVYSGPAVRFKRYAPGLRARGVDMRVVSGAWHDEDDRGQGGRTILDLLRGDYGHFVETLEVDGIPVHRVFLPSVNGKLPLIAYDRALARYCGTGASPDVLQLQDVVPWSLPWLWNLRRQGTPLVYVRTMMTNRSLASWKRRFSQLGYRFLDCIVTSSEVMRQDLRDAGVDARIEVIPNGVDLDRFAPVESGTVRRELRQKLRLDSERELIVFVGGFLSPRKGIDILAEAWAQIAPCRPNARLVLVGPELNDLRPEGPQKAFLEQVRQTLESSGAMDRVTFTGGVDNVEEYLQVADVFVFPSRREGMPNVVPEAFACGTPSVVTPFDGLPEEFGRPGREYLLVERTADALASTMDELLDDPERRRFLARSARRWVEQRLDVEDSLDRYADLYRELADQGVR